MNLLLDTHTLIWLLEGDENLSKSAIAAIQNSANTCFVSSASLWEIAIKMSISKLEMKIPFPELSHLIWENGIEILPTEFEHFLKVSSLPFHHKDPFDRIIIAQSLVEQMDIVGKDGYFADYGLRLIW